MLHIIWEDESYLINVVDTCIILRNSLRGKLKSVKPTGYDCRKSLPRQTYTITNVRRRTLQGTITVIITGYKLYGWCYFPSVWTEIKCNYSLFFRPYGQIYAHIYAILGP